jgi:hypothetical protein
VESTYFVVVAGPMSSAFVRTVQDRFECVRVAGGRSHTGMECLIRDQSALRALLTQLWDDGGEVLLVSQIPTESPRSRHGQAQH